MSSLSWIPRSTMEELLSGINLSIGKYEENPTESIETFIQTLIQQDQRSSESKSSSITITSDISTDLEILFREKIQHVVQTVEAKRGERDSELFRILKFSLLFASHSMSNTLSPNISKLPFLLLEEIFSSVTILRAEKLWTRLEELTEEITKPELFSKGQLIVLRICNSLLRKLSKTYHTEFCGRILMFLAAVYPLSEKSALNALGLVNSSNITNFDTEEDFNAAVAEQNSQPLSNQNRTNEDSMDIKDSTTEKTGSGLSSEEEGEIDSNDYSLPLSIDNNETKKDISKTVLGSVCTYDIYKTFWSLQSYFSSDTKSLDSSEKWISLQQSLSQVFHLLATATASHDSQSSLNQEVAKVSEINSNNSSNNSLDQTRTYFGCKYLTSAKLLGLQLRDPMLRQQLACQILFYTHYLRHRPPTYLTEIPVAPPTVVSLASKSTAASAAASSSSQSKSLVKNETKVDIKSSGRNQSTVSTNSTVNAASTSSSTLPGTRSVQNSTSSSNSTVVASSVASVSSSSSANTSDSTQPASNPVLDKFIEEVKAIESKAYDIIRNSPNGQELASVIRKLLYSESRFLKWKSLGCPPYERQSDESNSNSYINHNLESYKPSWIVNVKQGERYNVPRYLGKKAMEFKKVLDENPRVYSFDCAIENAKEYARLLADGIPSFKSFIQDYLDAEDPEQAIEDEYHPKHDNVYCWRLRRLLSNERLSVFESMPDGNITTGLIKMGLLKPMPVKSKSVESDLNAMTSDVDEEIEDESYHKVHIADNQDDMAEAKDESIPNSDDLEKEADIMNMDDLNTAQPDQEEEQEEDIQLTKKMKTD